MKRDLNTVQFENIQEIIQSCLDPGFKCGKGFAEYHYEKPYWNYVIYTQKESKAIGSIDFLLGQKEFKVNQYDVRLTFSDTRKKALQKELKETFDKKYE